MIYQNDKNKEAILENLSNVQERRKKKKEPCTLEKNIIYHLFPFSIQTHYLKPDFA